MSQFLVDANVISEIRKLRMNPGVEAWFQSHPDMYLSVLTIGELRKGANHLRTKSPRGSEELNQWIDSLCTDFGNAGRLLPITTEVVEAWAAIAAMRTLPVLDSLLAATAIAHGLTVATRNVRDFEDTGAAVFNPFDAA